MRPTVVIVDDSEGFRECLCALLEFQDFEVIVEAVDGSSAIPVILRVSPALVLLDLMLPGTSGFVVADRLASSGYQGPVVLVSSRRVPLSTLKVPPVVGFVAKEEISGETLRRFVDTAA